ncbi:type III-B CRISPR module RAMP protein Cmr4 [Neolewinella agarilytica]|uniref:CRISPR-associated protein, Cmr4 family n=1 Tax=Neolewinella agarilytica TaxID=478744 RepID=A0A1H9HC31_9BACT|nr:type III-B CRISPR module RAMP protein Cmr4 [Neolewinella agarilytica]SEQ59910.1 CRISPR-associated protein, Cmr4 family [Neolewinella agarilytica]
MSTTYTSHHYLIRALSNLHPGSGTNTFGNIDKVVQRDYASGLPTIHASSLKGALRELANYHHPPSVTKREGKPDKVTENAFIRHVFGSDNRRGQAANLQQGSHLFHDAQLLALPLRSSHQLFYLATTPVLLNAFLVANEGCLSEQAQTQLAALAATSTKKGEPVCLGGTEDIIYLEELRGRRKTPTPPVDALQALLGERIALLDVDDFANYCQQMPTLARNVLNNGISENLWYEEIVPRETRFYTRITNTRPDAEQRALATLLNDKAEVQIGANATVGYGFTEWSSLKKA